MCIRWKSRGAAAAAILFCVTGCGITVGWDDYGGLGGDTGETGDDYHPSFFIAECTDYVKCPNTMLNHVSYGLRAAMEASAWTGDSKLNSGVRLTQFIDGYVLPGLGKDDLGADAHVFPIYAGHANVGYMTVSWPDPETGDCSMRMGDFMNLGVGTGDTAAVLAMASSCSGYAPRDANMVPTTGCYRPTFMFSQIRQLLAFHNSPTIPDNQLEVFFNTLKVEAIMDLGTFSEPDYNNVDAWLDIMTTPHYPGTKENSPIVYTRRAQYGDEYLHLADIHYGANLYTGKWIKDMPEALDTQDIGISASTDLGANVQTCITPPEFQSWGCY